MKYRIVTDGSSLANGTDSQVGGWAYVVCDREKDKEFYDYGGKLGATNNQMEIKAVIEALRYITKITDESDEIEIVSDSAYVVNCFNQKWIDNWEKNGWFTSKKEPVKNREMWEELLKFVRSRHVVFTKVKGHAGDAYNEFVDRLAKKGATEETKGW